MLAPTSGLDPLFRRDVRGPRWTAASVSLAGILVASIIACSSSGGEGSDRVAIEELYAAWFSALEGGRVEETLALLDDDFLLKSPASPPTTDPDELARSLRELHRRFEEEIEWSLEEVRLADDWAVARVREETTLTDRQTGDSVRVEGIHLSILVRRGDRWRIATDVGSLDGTPRLGDDG